MRGGTLEVILDFKPSQSAVPRCNGFKRVLKMTDGVGGCAL